MKNLIILLAIGVLGSCSNEKNDENKNELSKEKIEEIKHVEVLIGEPIQISRDSFEILKNNIEPMKYGMSISEDNKDDNILDNNELLLNESNNNSNPAKYSAFGKPSGQENVPSSNINEEMKFVEILNQERKRKGLSVLEIDENLCRAARYHSYDMGVQEYFEHASYDRNNNGNLVKVCGTFDRIRVFGSCNAENIAAGRDNAESTYTQWFNSPGHNRNMFDKNWTRIGVGYVKVDDSPYTHYWTTDFGY